MRAKKTILFLILLLASSVLKSQTPTFSNIVNQFPFVGDTILVQGTNLLGMDSVFIDYQNNGPRLRVLSSTSSSLKFIVPNVPYMWNLVFNYLPAGGSAFVNLTFKKGAVIYSPTNMNLSIHNLPEVVSYSPSPPFKLWFMGGIYVTGKYLNGRNVIVGGNGGSINFGNPIYTPGNQSNPNGNLSLMQMNFTLCYDSNALSIISGNLFQPTISLGPVSVDLRPMSGLSLTGPNSNLCNGNPVNLFANTYMGCGGFLGCSFAWYLNGNLISSEVNSNNSSYIATQPGTYYVVVSNGCADTTNAIQINGGQNPISIITADGPTTFCAGNSVNLSVNNTPGATYQWNRNGNNITTNATSAIYKATSSGSYTCIVTNSCGTTTSNAIQVTSKTNAAPSVSAVGSTTFCAGDSVALNCTNLGANYSVQWYRTNVSMENATTFSTIVKQPGTYKVVTKNINNGCSRISKNSVIVAVNCRMANPNVMAVELVESDFNDRNMAEMPKGKLYIYPNPTSDNRFTVEFLGMEENGQAKLEIHDSMGKLLISEQVTIEDGSLERQVNLSPSVSGQLYMVRLIVGDKVFDSKVIVR